MSNTRVFRKHGDAKIIETWKPILESYGVTEGDRVEWLAEYAHNHAIFDNGNALFEQTQPGVFFQTPGTINGMGNPVAPTPGQVPFPGGAKGSYNDSGSGDKFPSLLPVAIQVAAKTIGFDLVPVIPMDSPVGFLPYLDYVYAGGRTDTEYEPFIIEVEGMTAAALGLTPAAGDVLAFTNAPAPVIEFVGFSRVNGNAILKIVQDDGTGDNIATQITNAGALTAIGANSVSYTIPVNGIRLASALENHIAGFTSVSDADYASTPFNGPFYEGAVPGSMSREAGELSKFRQMGLKMFTKFVEAQTDQVAISATVEQIQDMNRVWNYDVISMLENVAVNELAQSINKRLVDKIHNAATIHSNEVTAVEGAGLTTLNLAAGAGGFENVSTLQRRFVTKMLELSNLIYHRGRFGAGNFMVTSGRVASALADVAGYSIATAPNKMSTVAGNLYPAGEVYGMKVYVDPNLKFGDTTVTIGRKGGDDEPGVKFLPYIMAESLQTISEGTFSPKIGLKSRYAIEETGWHPETQYLKMDVSGDIGVLTGSVAIS